MWVTAQAGVQGLPASPVLWDGCFLLWFVSAGAEPLGPCLHIG